MTKRRAAEALEPQEPAASPTTEPAAAPSSQQRQAGDDAATDSGQKKWTPPENPFGFENKRGSGNRVRLLKSEPQRSGENGAWVIRFDIPPNEMTGYSKDNPHPVLKMLKDEGYRWGFDPGDGKGGWGKEWTNDPYGNDHLEARKVLAKTAEMIGAAKETERTPF
jgi:hypothetical protein